jgi:hypothetical protein
MTSDDFTALCGIILNNPAIRIRGTTVSGSIAGQSLAGSIQEYRHNLTDGEKNALSALFYGAYSISTIKGYAKDIRTGQWTERIDGGKFKFNITFLNAGNRIILEGMQVVTVPGLGLLDVWKDVGWSDGLVPDIMIDNMVVSISMTPVIDAQGRLSYADPEASVRADVSLNIPDWVDSIVNSLLGYKDTLLNSIKNKLMEGLNSDAVKNAVAGQISRRLNLIGMRIVAIRPSGSQVEIDYRAAQ